VNIKNILLLALVAGGIWGYGQYKHDQGYGRADNAWQSAWDRRDAADERAARMESEKRRTQENQYQQEKEKIARDSENLLNAANHSAADARAVSDRLHAEIGKLEIRLNAKRETDKLSGSVREQSARINTGMVCSELFRRIDERAGKLAEYADRARIRGQSCERQYNSVIGN
jgi:Protein of unknown function (DUF2514).